VFSISISRTLPLPDGGLTDMVRTRSALAAISSSLIQLDDNGLSC
jgi:hypothetical protein